MTSFLGKNIKRIQKNIWRFGRDISWQFEKRKVRQRLNQSVASDESDEQEKTVLFFAPEAGLTPHFASMCLLARTLQEQGHRVLMTQCFQLLSRCPVMDAANLPMQASTKEKESTCLHCTAESFRTLGEYGLPSLDLRTLMTPELSHEIRQAIENAPQNLLEFQYDSIDFGKLNTFDIVLRFKSHDFSKLTHEQRTIWLEYIETAMTSYLLADQLFKKYNIHRALHFNSYGMMLGFHLAASKHNIPTIDIAQSLHKNVDRRLIRFHREVELVYTRKMLEAWPKWRDLPLSGEKIKEIAEDLFVLFGGTGSHIYSPARSETQDIHEKLGLSKQKKLLVAYTSSLDEAVATQIAAEAMGTFPDKRDQPFQNQIQWLRALTAYVADHDELQLVVRVHPREGATKQRLFPSQHLLEIKEAFSNLQHNCHFVWPEENISSYDLGEAADLVLVSWSSIGLEMARLGVPVLASINDVVDEPHDDFIERCNTEQEYFKTLESILIKPVSLDQIARAFRWYNLFRMGPALDFSDVIPHSDFRGIPKFRMPLEAAAVQDAIIHCKDVIEINFERCVAARSENLGPEKYELRKQLRRLIHFLYTGVDSEEDTPLQVSVNNDLTHQPQQRQKRILINGSDTVYETGEERYTRFSPLVARLAPLCGDVQASLSQKKNAAA